MNASPWWSEALFYQIYPRSFFDSNGDGEGDLRGITEHLDYIRMLGADAIWLSPFYPSPNKDGGYDVSNPRDVDPRHGNLKDAEALIFRAHDLNLKVLVDIIPNHFSSDHQWFKAAAEASRGSSERLRFHFYDGKDGNTPPNNWISLFGGPAWTQVADGQWYLHLFDSSQPDLNWESLDVRADFERTIRFWIDLGVDGFRIDVAHGLVKENILQDHFDPDGLSRALRLDVQMDVAERNALLASAPFFDRDGVHEIYREWRRIFDSYDREIVAVAEAWVQPPERATLYVRHDELQQVFNLDLLVTPFDDKALFACIERTLQLMGSVGASPTWALSNHDTPRLASRVGDAQARALALFTFGLPGSCYVYQGQELGLPDAQLADSERQDPAFFRSHGSQKGRDGARVPLPWSGEKTPFGFSSEKLWLPIPQEWAPLTVERQSGDATSSLEMYRSAIEIRRNRLQNHSDFKWTRKPDGSGLISYRRGSTEVILNTAPDPIRMASEGHLLISSNPTLRPGNTVQIEIGGESCIWLEIP